MIIVHQPNGEFSLVKPKYNNFVQIPKQIIKHDSVMYPDYTISKLSIFVFVLLVIDCIVSLTFLNSVYILCRLCMIYIGLFAIIKRKTLLYVSFYFAKHAETFCLFYLVIVHMNFTFLAVILYNLVVCLVSLLYLKESSFSLRFQ